MKFVGWTFIEQCLPWTKVFDVEIFKNKDFEFVPADGIDKMLVQCDLYGFVRKGIISYGFAYLLDYLFVMYGINIKQAYNDRRQVIYKGQSIKCLDDKYNDKIISEYKPSADANVTIIDGKYAYFNCTSYKFYDQVDEFIQKEFDAANLGGWLVKLGVYKEIDSLLKDAMQKDTKTKKNEQI